MAAMLSQSMSKLSLSGSNRPQPAALGFCRSMRGTQLSVSRQNNIVSNRPGSLVVVAAQNSLQRIRLSEKQRLYNKAHKSAVATRMKKVLKALSQYTKVEAEEELAPVQKLLNEAYQEIDKAVVKGVMHKNTAARRKSRLASARQRILISSGLYTPA